MKKRKQQVAVILNQDVPDVGFAGELLSVKPGFMRNFLSPGKLADLATPQRRQERESEMAKAEQRRQAETDQRRETAEQLEAETINLKLKTGPDGQVFGAVTAKDVAAAIKKQRSLEVDTKRLSGLPISNLGTQTVFAKLGLGVTAAVPLNISGQAATPERGKDKGPASKPATSTAT